jgi:Tfp pilus assembly protein PilF
MAHRLLTRFNPNNLLATSFPVTLAKAGGRRESSEIYDPRSGQNPDIEPLRGNFLINWIPACAGMTSFCFNGQSGLSVNVKNNAFIFLSLLGLLYGCAAEQPKKMEIQPAKSAGAEVVISPETRADFDAAMTHLKAEEYDAGIKMLSSVVKAAPHSPVASVNLALAYQKTGKPAQAEVSLKQALSIDADNPVANNELALLYRKTGKIKEARQIYEKMLDKYPNYKLVHKNLGILCDLYMRDYECALKHYVFYSDVVQDDKTVKIWIADVQKRLRK